MMLDLIGQAEEVAVIILIDKVMYCYNCKESSAISTKTIKTTNIPQESVSKYARRGNGHAKITLIEKIR